MKNLRLTTFQINVEHTISERHAAPEEDLHNLNGLQRGDYGRSQGRTSKN